MLCDERVQSVYYCSPDPISNLKVRVSLSKLSVVRGSNQSQNNRNFSVQHTFQWQQKVENSPQIPVITELQNEADEQQDQNENENKLAENSDDVRKVMLQSYVNEDEFAQDERWLRPMTTSKSSQFREQVMVLGTEHKKTMFIVAQILTSFGEWEEHVLLQITHCEGSNAFQMKPAFSEPGNDYRFEDSEGCTYRYSLELASQNWTSQAEARQSQLRNINNLKKKQEELSQSLIGAGKPIGPGGQRLFITGEIVLAQEFYQDYLYVKYKVHFQQQDWNGEGELEGVTQISRMRKDDLTGKYRAHFAHPLEIQLWPTRSKTPHSSNPVLLLQVCSLDKWERYTCQGYGYLQLQNEVCTHMVRTWKPTPTSWDGLQEFFLGGSKELADLSSMFRPATQQGKPLCKYGQQTTTSGEVQVRINGLLQKRSKLLSDQKSSLQNISPSLAQILPNRKQISLAAILERARRRLAEAKGKDYKPAKLHSHDPPIILQHPESAQANEGDIVQFKVKAIGGAPINYRWYKDGDKLDIASSDEAMLVISSVCESDGGNYHCVVSNKDGRAKTRDCYCQVIQMRQTDD